LDGRHASQIAELVNAHNQLSVRYDADRVLRSDGTYFYELSDGGDVIACVELRRVQWYQLEIDHLTVAPAARARGLAFGLLQRCEAQARERGGRLLQCTIREGNAASERLFERNGFTRVGGFFNAATGNNVGVWQKVLSPVVRASS
jgi:ribosomal protein S18 acetylase RimI-like enzyme